MQLELLNGVTITNRGGGGKRRCVVTDKPTEDLYIKH